MRQVGCGIQARQGASHFDTVGASETKVVAICCTCARLVHKLHCGRADISRCCSNGNLIEAWPICAPIASLIAWAVVGICLSTGVRCALIDCCRLTFKDNIRPLSSRQFHKNKSSGTSLLPQKIRRRPLERRTYSRCRYKRLRPALEPTRLGQVQQ